MDNWIKTALCLPRIEDADQFDNVLVRDSVGQYLVQWYNVTKVYHFEWSKTNAPPDAISDELRPQIQFRNGPHSLK